MRGEEVFTHQRFCKGILVGHLLEEHQWNLKSRYKLCIKLKDNKERVLIIIMKDFFFFFVPAPVMFDPLNDVFPVAVAPSKLAFVKFTCKNVITIHH